jgi:hypothetical protein
MKENGKMTKVYIIFQNKAHGQGVYTHMDGARYSGSWFEVIFFFILG